MKQLLQSVRTGAVRLTEVPAPGVGKGQLLVQVRASLISVGTERMVTEFASKSLLAKAKARPDLVRQALDKAHTEGVLTALDAVRTRLDQPLALGYACAGVVIAVGEDTADFYLGDRVACAGGGYAVHAEVVSVPKNLVVKVPDSVDLETAACTTLGAIALQGIRLAHVQLGEVVAVLGLGLLGQLTVQMLKATGCTVIGMDLRPERAALAQQCGADVIATSAEQLATLCREVSAGHGVDTVLITADTESNQPVELAGHIARDKGIIVAVGAVGMHIPRKVYYEKELDFRISRSYGPGRYDVTYEEQGRDYPIGYVRWTENRNMQAFLQLLAAGRVNATSLITHRFPLEEAIKAYDLITHKTSESFLGVLITYPFPDGKMPSSTAFTRRVHLGIGPASASLAAENGQRAPVAVGLLGAGNFATATLLPAMRKVQGIEYISICTARGLSAQYAGTKFGFRSCTTDENAVLNDPDVNTVVIATRHHLHARQVLAALCAGKHVFCEKPLCLHEQELAEIVQTYNTLLMQDGPQTADTAGCDGAQLASVRRQAAVVMVGYNRRFAPMVTQLKAFLADVGEPLVMHYRVNAGALPLDHWVHDPSQGGGRILGEVCHFVDLLTFLAGALAVRVYTQMLPNHGRYQNDNVIITLEFADGSLGTITYVANGDKAFSKERLEIFGGGVIAVLDDFRRLELVRHGHKKVYRSHLRQDKGHRGEWEAFVAAVRAPTSLPIPFGDLVSTTLTTFAMLESCKQGLPVAVGRVSGDRMDQVSL